ncbi:unnamed protein product [Symbiodinium natans]|uniref:Uncharacterized protein n=1 Tax=Symbiodinium natans TaxID=878477 RepID=A0A812HS42_9DINO|nr:unnamed protein product [Symbiodinium natans]
MALAEEAGSCDEVTQPLKNGTGDLVGFMQAKISHALQKDSVEKEHVACRKVSMFSAEDSDSRGREQTARDAFSKSAQRKAVECSGNVTDHAVMGTAATDRSEMQVNFTNATSLYGFYCYDAHHGTTAAYATYQDVASREVCQQICASDASCNFYGWHGSSVSLEAPSRCYNCALYQTCQFQRTSVCKDITPPSNFEKSVKDAAAQRVEKEFTADFELNGQFCQRSQVFAAQVANESLCRSFCESIEDCKVMAFYMDARVREDAAPDSCDQNCRLYAECDSPVPSLCFHPPVLWSVHTTTTTTTVTTTTTSTTTTTVVPWFVGDAEDSCNDLCHFKGYAGCDTEKTAEIVTQSNISDLMGTLNKSCISFGVLNNYFPGYTESDEKCYYLGGTLDCDAALHPFQPVCHCNSTTSSTTLSARWFVGERQDTCNDLCRYKGYTGCDAQKTGELFRRPRLTRVMDHLNMSCTSFGGTLNNYFPGYNEDTGNCHLLGGTLDCDKDYDPFQPVCHCNDTTSTTTLSARWFVGDPQDTCNDLCRYKGYTGCDAQKTGELFRRPRLTRVMDHLNISCTSFGGTLNNYFPGYNEATGNCHLLGGTLDCDKDYDPFQPVCHCNDTTSTTTLSARWFVGDPQDTCNDLCRYKGYTGCDAQKTGELFRRPRLTRVMDHLNISCTSFGGTLNNYFPGYNEATGNCHLLGGTLDCDKDYDPFQPVCHCNDTTSTTTLSALWFVGEPEDTCNDLCRYKGYAGCDAEETAKLVRKPIMSRLMNGLNSSCAFFGSPLNNQFPGYTESDDKCHYLQGTLNCDRYLNPIQPVCKCSDTTSTTTLSALWFVGELGDSCDDLCEFEGYAGCDAEEMGEIKTRPRISRLLAGLNTTGQYSCSSYNPIANSPAYNPSGETCYPLSGQVKCGNTVQASLQPICRCNSTTLTTTIGAGIWVLGALGDSCNTTCTSHGHVECDTAKMGEIYRPARVKRVFDSLNYTCNGITALSHNPGYRPSDGQCYYLSNANSLNCGTNPYASVQPLCYCQS